MNDAAPWPRRVRRAVFGPTDPERVHSHRKTFREQERDVSIQIRRIQRNQARSRAQLRQHMKRNDSAAVNAEARKIADLDRRYSELKSIEANISAVEGNMTKRVLQQDVMRETGEVTRTLMDMGAKASPSSVNHMMQHYDRSTTMHEMAYEAMDEGIQSAHELEEDDPAVLSIIESEQSAMNLKSHEHMPTAPHHSIPPSPTPACDLEERLNRLHNA